MKENVMGHKLCFKHLSQNVTSFIIGWILISSKVALDIDCRNRKKKLSRKMALRQILKLQLCARSSWYVEIFVCSNVYKLVRKYSMVRQPLIMWKRPFFVKSCVLQRQTSLVQDTTLHNFFYFYFFLGFA